MSTAIITGGSTGIGQACVNLLAEHYEHIFNLDIQASSNQPNNAEWIECDITDTKNLTEVIQMIHAKTGSINALVSNAGMHLSATIEQTSEDEFDQVFNLNLRSTFFLLKAVLPIMREQQHGNIVIMGSEQSVVGKPHSAAYGLTKGALAQLTKSTAIDYAAFNIRVNCVCPGTTDTPLYRKAIERYHQTSGVALKEIEQDEARLQPLNRIGKPEEVAELVSFLLSEKAEFITGALMPIDGGYTCQ